MAHACRRIPCRVSLFPLVPRSTFLGRLFVGVSHLGLGLGSVLRGLRCVHRDILCTEGRLLPAFVWRIGECCSPVVRRLFCMCSRFLLVFGGIARTGETRLSLLARIGTSCRILRHAYSFAVGVLVAVCGFGGRTVRSTSRSSLRGEVGLVLT